MWASMNKANDFIFKLYYECLFFSLPVTAVRFSAAALFPLLHDSRLTTNSDIKLMSFKSLWINITLILEMMVPLFLSGTSLMFCFFFLICMLHIHVRSCDMLRISLKFLSTCELEILWTYRDGDSHATVTLHHYCVRITWTGEASGLLLVLQFTSSQD